MLQDFFKQKYVLMQSSIFRFDSLLQN